MTQRNNQSTPGGMENPSLEAEHDFCNPEEPQCSNDDAISFTGINDHVRDIHAPTDKSTGEDKRPTSDWPGKTIASDDKSTDEDNTSDWTDKTTITSGDESTQAMDMKRCMGLVHRDAEKWREMGGEPEAQARSGGTCGNDDEIKGLALGESICGRDSERRCSHCLAIYYCSEECGRSHWRIHKTNCINAHVRFVAKHFVERGIYQCCLIASTILVERLRKYNIVAFIKDGYCVELDKSFAYRHVWVENANGIRFNIGFRITAALFPKEASMKCTLVSELPQGVIRTDNETAHERNVLGKLENDIGMVHDKKIEEYLLGAPKRIYQIYAICIQ